MKYDKSQANNSITAVDIVSFILSQFATIDEVRSGMESVRVVPVVEEML
jgi:choloylglycine hydrolase